MPLMLRNGRTILFVHIPKTGGSSVTDIARMAGWKILFELRGLQASQIRFCRCSPQHYHADLLEAVLDMQHIDHVFTVVRHPEKRLLSEYLWQCRQGATRLEPEAWIDAALRLRETDPYAHDNHLRRQVEFVPATDRITILRNEDDGVDRLLREIGVIVPSDQRDQMMRKRSDSRARDWAGPVFNAHAARIRDAYAADYERFGYT